jgi:hypothetical protein
MRHAFALLNVTDFERTQFFAENARSLQMA